MKCVAIVWPISLSRFAVKIINIRLFLGCYYQLQLFNTRLKLNTKNNIYTSSCKPYGSKKKSLN